ncbi:F8A1-like protein [Clonorchis sinensis]|uniref:F8A1-like protein n=1 Tax=Clonorchis sinensis TaxID=79923 RepID=G7YSX6_CLOSI|nr:F8A1-like protein [Clonorchis sinensis]
MRRMLEGLQNLGVQIASDENLVELEYADDIVLIFEEEKAQVFLDELTKVTPSFETLSHPNLSRRIHELPLTNVVFTKYIYQPLHKANSFSSLGDGHAYLQTCDRLSPYGNKPNKLTSVPGEVVDRILNLMSSAQHVFLSNLACVTNMLVFMDNLTEAKDEGLISDAIFLDFSKTFNRDPQVLLLRKPESYGIQGEILRCIKAFLSDRTFRVKVYSFSAPVCISCLSHCTRNRFIVIILDSMTSVFKTDAPLPYNHDLFRSLIVKKRIKAKHSKELVISSQYEFTSDGGAFGRLQKTILISKRDPDLTDSCIDLISHATVRTNTPSKTRKTPHNFQCLSLDYCRQLDKIKDLRAIARVGWCRRIRNEAVRKRVLGGATAEASTLFTAAKYFLQAEDKLDCLNAITHGDNLDSATSCFLKAAKLYESSELFTLAANVYIFLCDNLIRRKKWSEAIPHLKRTLEILARDLLCSLQVLSKLVSCQLGLGDWVGALNTCLRIQALVSEASAGQGYSLDSYSVDAVSGAPEMNEALFLHLQSLILAYRSGDVVELESTFSALRLYLDADQCDILSLLVNELTNPFSSVV